MKKSIMYFKTPDGLKLSKTKLERENTVPLGVYYDEGEKLSQLRIRLEEDVLPLLVFLEGKIIEEFKLDNNELEISASLESDSNEHKRPWCQFQSICNDWLNQKGADDFSFFVNIACKKQAIGWGTQVHVFLDCIHWISEDKLEEYSVWFLNICGIEQNIDTELSTTQMVDVINLVLAQLWRCYRIESTGVWED